MHQLNYCGYWLDFTLTEPLINYIVEPIPEKMKDLKDVQQQILTLSALYSPSRFY